MGVYNQHSVLMVNITYVTINKEISSGEVHAPDARGGICKPLFADWLMFIIIMTQLEKPTAFLINESYGLYFQI